MDCVAVCFVGSVIWDALNYAKLTKNAEHYHMDSVQHWEAPW